jgi:hypothetical protein
VQFDPECVQALERHVLEAPVRPEPAPNH